MVRVVLVVCGFCSAAAAQSPGDAPPYAPTAAPPQSTLVAPPARPRSDRGMVALGVLVGGGGPSDWLYGAYHAEGSITLLAEPLRLRGRLFGVLAGGTMESDWSGDFSRVGAGIEARWCTAGLGTCFFGDLDVGYQAFTLDDHNGDFVRSDKGMVVGPRAGVDVGGAVRVRFALEMYRMIAHHVGSGGEDNRSFGTVALSLAVGYQL